MKTKLLILFGLLAAFSFGQTTITSTTTSALLSNTATSFNVASATGIAVPSFSTPNQPTGNQTLLFVDKEAMLVVGVNGTYISVIRGYNQTRAGIHVSGATVWVGPPTAFNNTNPSEGGGCLRTALLYVPYINTATGDSFDCLGVTTAGQWVKTSSPGVTTVGTSVASATSITPTAQVFPVSGTTAIATIVVPAGFKPGMSITILPSGIWATTTAGNIAVITSATVVSRALIMVWNGTKWYPSYIS